MKGKRFFLIELIDFVSIIDVYNDAVAYKIQICKGKGIRRVNRADQLKVNLNLEDFTGKSLWKFSSESLGTLFYLNYIIILL